MEIICKAIYKINYDTDNINEITPPDGFEVFVQDMIEYINNNEVTRLYKTKSQSCQIVTDIKGIIDVAVINKELVENTESVELCMSDIAKRLLDVEKSTQDQIYKMGQNVRKGSLIQALISEDDTYQFLLAKVEHTTFVDDEDFTFKTGFSSEQRKIWKTCVMDCNIDEDQITIDDARIYLERFVKYWPISFLELEEVIDDEANTKKSFKSIDRVLNNQIKKTAPSDYTVIRNSIVGYYKQNGYIDYNDMINTALESYQPTDMSLEQVNDLRTKLLKLPEEKKFDRQFTPIAGAINAKIRKVYPVYDGIELKIKGYVGDLKEIISSYEDEAGNRFLKIKTDDNSTYNYFR